MSKEQTQKERLEKNEANQEHQDSFEPDKNPDGTTKNLTRKGVPNEKPKKKK